MIFNENVKKTLPLSDHLQELRVRLLYIIFSLSLTFISAYFYSEELCFLLTKPLFNTNFAKSFIYTDMTEAFTTYLDISFFLSIYFCFPLLAYHIWAFFIPGLYEGERNRLGYFILITFALFSLGCALAYFIIFPVAWNFFLSFEVSSQNLNVELQPKINQYISLVIRLFTLFGIVFQFPMYVILLVDFKLITTNWFIDKRNFAYVIAFIIAAFLSPPDVLSQILIAIPIILFYEFSIFIMKLIEQYRK